ncbi:hypothetical protein [Planctomicrobium piriforme]|uniref:hypothetical protein n=1 Tax=Planctomicrobium piriforme TaxID=1576369 RepID=UPI00111412BF|nr:hypothetical protein [Planctomicrobium piriforme]
MALELKVPASKWFETLAVDEIGLEREGFRRSQKSISRRFKEFKTESGKFGIMGVKKTGKGRRKLGRKKRRMRARIRHRKG